MGSNYRTFLLRISENVTLENLEKLKFLCSDDIEEGELEKIILPLQLFKALEKRELITIDSLSFLRELLANVKCFQSVTEIDDFTLRRELELLALTKQRGKIKQGYPRCVRVEGATCRENQQNEPDSKERGFAVCSKSNEEELKEMCATCSQSSCCLFCSHCHSSQRKPGEIHLKVILKLASKGVWFAGTAFILKRYINDPKTLVHLFATVVLPSGILVKYLCEGSVLCVLEANDLEGLYTLWQNYENGILKKALEEVLITEDLQKLSEGQEIILNVVLDREMYQNVCLELILNKEKVEELYKGVKQRPRSLSDPRHSRLGKPENSFEKESFRIMANTERKRRLDAQKKLDKVVSGQYLELRFPELFQLNGTGKKTQDAGDDTSSTTSTLDEEEMLDWEDDNDPSNEFWSSIKGGLKEKPWKNFEDAINKEFSDDLKRGGTPLLKFLAYVLNVDYDKKTSETVHLRHFIRTSKWFGSFIKGSQGCIRKMIDLMEHSVSVGSDGKRSSWFAGYMTEEEAKEKLKNEKGETFLVRFNSSWVAPGFVLSKKSCGSDAVVEFNIEVNQKSGFLEFSDRVFHSLPALVTELRESWMADVRPFYSTEGIMEVESVPQQF